LTNETTRLRGELIETEKQIQQAQSEAGVISTEDSKAAYSSQITKLRDQPVPRKSWRNVRPRGRP
jgi:hypothetical protein